MVDTIGLPTVFSTHSAADLKWPELAHLSCPEEPDSSASQSKALIKKPAGSPMTISTSSLMYSKKKFLTIVCTFNGNTMATSWQHHGNPHVHGLALHLQKLCAENNW